MRTFWTILAILSVFWIPRDSVAAAAGDDVVLEVPATELLERLARGKLTSVKLVNAYFQRIARIDHAGPRLNSFITLNPEALDEARALDAERKAGKLRGPLHGLPIVVKDNIETRDRMPTTSGSLALAENFTGRDSPGIARLRAAGVIILGKANLSEWANARSPFAIAGWSALGGLTRNPYLLTRSACGSSSGTAAAVAASLAAIGVGTETRGSIVCPASSNGLVGLKPTIGFISHRHVVPNSVARDTLGPLGRNVRDVALLFSFMVGSDPGDPLTANADRHREDFTQRLTPDALKGVRLGVLRPPTMQKLVADRFALALDQLRSAGAVLVEIPMPNLEPMLRAQNDSGRYELKVVMNAYLASLPASAPVHSLSDIVAFNRAHAAREMSLFGQENFEQAETLPGLEDPSYLGARQTALALARDAGLDLLFETRRVAALIMPSYGPARSADPVGVDPTPSYNVSNLVAVAGYPHLSVPMGLVRGMPVGLSFIGPEFSDGEMLRLGYAFEAAGPLRQAPRYLSDLPPEGVTDPLGLR